MTRGDAPTALTVAITVNGEEHRLEVEPRTLLVYLLRERLGLTGTHIGCDTSQCGACTVLLDGAAVKSCTILAAQADGCHVTTVEGLATSDKLHPIQVGFWEKHGLQCGFCTPGVMMVGHELIQRNPNATAQEIREGLDGVYCRCTGYQNIVRAIQYAARQWAAEKSLEEAAVAKEPAGLEGGEKR